MRKWYKPYSETDSRQPVSILIIKPDDGDDDEISQTEAVAFYTWFAEISYQPWNYGADSGSPVYRHSSSKEESAYLARFEHPLRGLPLLTSHWRPTEAVDKHDQGRHGTPIRTASLRLHTMKKGLSESL